MKSVISGFSIHNFFAKRTLLAKFVGLTLYLGGGTVPSRRYFFPLRSPLRSFYGEGAVSGKEGPFVHIAGILAHQLLRLTVFDKIRGVLFSSLSFPVSH